LKYFILILLFISGSGIDLWSQKSPFTKTEIQFNDTLENSYSFFVSGHFYGGSDNKTGYPVNSILGSSDFINSSNAKMLICLGDLFKDVKNDHPYYQKSLFSSLEVPLFNAVGNHDLTDDYYQKNFGETFYSFKIDDDIHIVLDTELDDGNITAGQLQLLTDALEVTRGGGVKNVFIYAHRTIWKDSFEELDPIFKDNTQSIGGNNFESDVLPILNELKQETNVYIFAGSMGGAAPASFFHHENDGITYMATAVRGLKRDAILKIESKDGKLTFETVSLTGQDLLELEEYDLDYWMSNTADESFNWRLLPLYIKTILLHYVFWIGIFTALFLVFSIRLFKKWRAKRKAS